MSSLIEADTSWQGEGRRHPQRFQAVFSVRWVGPPLTAEEVLWGDLAGERAQAREGDLLSGPQFPQDQRLPEASLSSWML